DKVCPWRARKRSPRSTSARTAFTCRSAAWWTGRFIPWTACARWCASAPASAPTSASTAPRRRGRSRRCAPSAKTAPQFLREARQELGFPIEVIAGREEARLIYLGVAHSMPPAPHKRLVMDIGGGSTEFIIGTGLEPQLTESLYMGCVSYSLKYFAEGRIDKFRFKAAELAARQELD